MIEPTVGRNLHYFLAGKHDDPHACLLVGVNNERSINLAVFNHDGSHFRAVDTQLLQDGDLPPDNAPYAAWMAYQKGQAAKTEQLQAAAAAAPSPDKTPPAAPADLSDLHSKLDTLENGIDGKFGELGDWLTGVVRGFHVRLGSLEQSVLHGGVANPAPTPAPFTPAPGDKPAPQPAQQQPAS